MIRKGFRVAIGVAAFATLLLLPNLGWAEETRTGNIDMVLLVDSSLSMRDAMAATREFAAAELIAPILMPGDRLILERFYGKVERLFGGTIRSEADKAAIIRSLRGIVADGRYTDIGAALDQAAADIKELGMPERPKYLILLTDERQEAPPGSPYASADFIPRHPFLTYVKKEKKGRFSFITVGYGVGEKIAVSSRSVLSIIEEAPLRAAADFPALPKGSAGNLDAAASEKGGFPRKIGTEGYANAVIVDPNSGKSAGDEALAGPKGEIPQGKTESAGNALTGDLPGDEASLGGAPRVAGSAASGTMTTGTTTDGIATGRFAEGEALAGQNPDRQRTEPGISEKTNSAADNRAKFLRIALFSILILAGILFVTLSLKKKQSRREEHNDS